ncbi:MAG: IMS domain-containing protein [Crocosphaera sp.]
MRIPLDYYRILGIFPQATDEQLRQAYRDRTIQLPRREYSVNAIEGRKQLLEVAYNVLSNPDQKANYESQFWQAHASSVDDESSVGSGWKTQGMGENSLVSASEIDIEAEAVPGSLLILHELGEYELVIKHGEIYLQILPSSSLSLDIDDTVTKSRSDTILSIALAYLEISREQWHQEAYEAAALAGEKGLTLLEKNSLFPSIQREIRTEIDKLRPYRILELLAAPLNRQKSRQTGIELLKSMLEQRQGIDGKRDDHSGLGIDEFLRFIQQIRNYLTAAEQQDLFMEEAQRPSSVAAYLGVYALIAEGFAHKKPALIVEAQTVLEGLEPRQDVSIEQAIVALLLGQTQKAGLALKQCQDQPALQFIQDHSHGAPDLLPGLCLYSEHWLQTEVFAHFRDLKDKNASLEGYFADKQVQTYLDRLLLPSSPKPQGVKSTHIPEQSRSRLKNNPYPTYQPSSLNFDRGNTALAPVPLPVSSSDPVDIREVRRRKRKNSLSRPHLNPTRETNHQTVLEPQSNLKTVVSEPIVETNTVPQRRLKRSTRRVNVSRGKLGLMVLGIVGGIGVVALGISWINQATSPLSALEQGQYSVSLHKPLIDIPAADAQMVTATGMLTEDGAQQVIETWLSSKSQAFGKEHQIDSLDKILANPLLSRWRSRAQKLERNQNYWTYQHQVKVKSFQPSANNPNQAVVIANVQEKAQYYQRGQASRSYNDNLQVRYDLIRQGDRWKIRAIDIIN